MPATLERAVKAPQRAKHVKCASQTACQDVTRHIWEEMNERLMAKLDTSGEGEVGEAKFTSYFLEALPRDRSAFDAEISNFMEVIERRREGRG